MQKETFFLQTKRNKWRENERESHRKGDKKGESEVEFLKC